MMTILKNTSKIRFYNQKYIVVIKSKKINYIKYIFNLFLFII